MTMANVTVKDVKVIVTAPRNINLLVVKVETNEPGLYGYGCATFTWRYKAVVSAIEDYLSPVVIGRNVEDIEDIWQTMKGSSYWRNGPVLNNAISGIEEALWDIKGKMANLPLYSLLGGRSRTGIAVYRHADGDSVEAVEECIAAYREEGYRYIRCQMGTYGGNFDGTRQEIVRPKGSFPGAYYDSKTYMRSVNGLFGRIRRDLGWDLELMHDIHERLAPADALSLAKDLEQYKLFFLEDALPPAHGSYLRYLREQTSVPLAMGELFSNNLELRDLVQNQWIDFIRLHISDVGGISPAVKLAHFCDLYGVRTAFHGPSDLSPVGMVAQMHIDLHLHNFGIQEFCGFSDEEREVFVGCPEVCKDGYVYLSDKPGIGIEVDETAAVKFPPVDMDFSWLYSRIADGTAVRP
jgi:mannonate dehydratase